MRKWFVVLSGTNIAERRETVFSATDTLGLVRRLMKLRRPGVRIEDERGNPVSFFQLKDEAALESRKHMAQGPKGGTADCEQEINEAAAKRAADGVEGKLTLNMEHDSLDGFWEVLTANGLQLAS